VRRLNMSEIERIADVLHNAAETHHVVWRISNGDDPDWASWYSDWLLDLSELPGLLGTRPIRSHLVHPSSSSTPTTQGRSRVSGGRRSTHDACSNAFGDLSYDP